MLAFVIEFRNGDREVVWNANSYPLPLRNLRQDQEFWKRYNFWKYEAERFGAKISEFVNYNYDALYSWQHPKFQFANIW